jgi:serine/threonine-protein phosphatase CPPED1
MNNSANKFVLLALILFLSACNRQFTFVQMCDTQLGMGGYEHDKATFKQAVRQINNLDPDFVVICGDLVHWANDSSFNDFNNIKAGFNMPCHCAPGNHDVENTPSDTSLVKYRKAIGEDYFSFKNKGHAFIVCNTQLWKVPTENESDKHDLWFKETLAETGGNKNPTFIVGHYPLFVKEPNEKENYYSLSLEKRAEILVLLEQNNVAAWLAGHTHKRIVNSYNGIQLVNGETTSKNFDKRPMGFRLWNVSKDSIGHQFVALDSASFLHLK